MAASGHAASARPFSVADSIAMTEILDPAPSYEQGAGHAFKHSPDGRRFVAVVRRGHLIADENEYDLMVFDTAEVLEAINAPDRTMPPGDVVVTRRTSSDKRGIENVMWRDNDRIAFIGRTGEGVGQVYSVNTGSRSIERLTDVDAGIFTFDLALSDKLVYSAPVLPDWRERNRRGYVVDAAMLDSIVRIDPKDAVVQDLAFFVKDLGSGATSSLDVGRNWVASAWGSLPLPNEIAISPDGRWAVLLAIPWTVPIEWAEYGFLREYLSLIPGLPGMESKHHRAALDALVPQAALVPRAYTTKQFFLVDLTKGTTRPLINAPGSIGWGTQIQWAPDSRRVLVGPTFLPLGGIERPEREHRAVMPAIVEVEVPSRNVTRLTDRTEAIKRLAWQPDGSAHLEWRKDDSAESVAARFRKSGASWLEDSPVPASVRRRLEVQIQEGMNTPAEIVAIDHKTKRRRTLTDLNPQFRALTLGQAETFEWRDRFGRRYRGGLLLPPGFRADRRYPIVLQTYGFYPDEFLVDGSQRRSTAYSARALANKDMVVLQMPFGAIPEAAKSAWDWNRDAENPQFVSMMEGAIDALDAQGLVDRSRVGLIGFSHEGIRVHYAVTFSDYPIAAATIAHSFQATPFTYAVSFGNPYPAGSLALEDRKLIGAPFWGDGISKWMERSPAFHLNRIRTPLRLEHLSTNVPEYWDTFVHLRRHQRPVEMIHIPDAAHQLERPVARYTSQQGNVDWFAYWLKDEIDPHPSKATQYDRWQVLRQQRDAHRRELVRN